MIADSNKPVGSAVLRAELAKTISTNGILFQLPQDIIDPGVNFKMTRMKY